MGALEWALVAAAVVAAGGLGFWLLRRGRAPAGDGDFYHFRCPGCKRRLRYQNRQVGHLGKCANCGRAITFPPVSQSVE